MNRLRFFVTRLPDCAIWIAAFLVGWAVMCLLFAGCAASGPQSLAPDPEIQMLADHIDHATSEIKTEIASNTETSTVRTGETVKAEIKELRGSQNIGAFSGGGGVLLLVVIALVAAYFGVRYLIISKLLGIVTGAVKAAPEGAGTVVKDEVKELAGKLWQWVLDNWLKNRNLKA